MCCLYTKTNQPRHWSGRAGTSLVEIMIASVVLAVLALGVAASIEQSRSKNMMQRQRRTAAEVANGRMEALRAAAYSDLLPLSQNYNWYFLRFTGNVWSVSSSDPGETVTINQQNRPMRTRVQYVDADGGSSSYDCLRLQVQVQFARDVNSLVIVETMKAP
jgi:Tfp pilus assembly protein PilV